MSEHSLHDNFTDRVAQPSQATHPEFKPEDYQAGIGNVFDLSGASKKQILELGFPDLNLAEALPLKSFDSARSPGDATPAEPVSGLGRFLLNRQESVASRRDTLGYCWPAVADVYDLSHPESKASGFSAKDASATFARDHRFKEQPNNSELKVATETMTPGCVVVLSPSQIGRETGHPHGHIFVYMGKGEIVDGPDQRPHFVPQEKMKDPSKALPVEASDHFEYIHAKQIYDYSKTRVFKPVSEQV